jgi:hypothetical protein
MISRLGTRQTVRIHFSARSLFQTLNFFGEVHRSTGHFINGPALTISNLFSPRARGALEAPFVRTGDIAAGAALTWDWRASMAHLERVVTGPHQTCRPSFDPPKMAETSLPDWTRGDSTLILRHLLNSAARSATHQLSRRTVLRAPWAEKMFVAVRSHA